MSERRRSTTSRKVNRAQRKAMDVRAAESNAAAENQQNVVADPHPDESTVRPTRKRNRATRAPSVKVAPLSRSKEYAFIRADFRRLLVTASSLLALMLVLLVVV
ncbi:hypothetical protein BH23CHL5_BH23CHL5_22830 [soil metagenome]